MRRALRRIAIGALVVVLVIVGTAVGGVALVTNRALPQVSGRLAVPGLEAPVDVVRDSAGIVHITADSPHDLFLAQGYIHAQERLWQMVVWRHISSGRLAELFGPTQLRTDRFIRTLGWRSSAERDLAALAPDVRAALDAYADGVNAYLAARGDSLGLAFLVAGLRHGDGLGGYRPEPWTALDSVAWAKVQAWNLSGNFDNEVFRLVADARLGDPALTDRLFPEYPDGAPVIVPDEAGTASAPRGTVPGQSPAAGPRMALGGDDEAALLELIATAARPALLAGLDAGGGLGSGHGIGSNSWVVAPSRSATGSALIANDPHLGISMPSIWFMNGLHCRTVSAACPFGVAGVSFPGVPAVVLGHNARIAWGATNANPDVQDLYVVDVDPADASRYLFHGTSRPFETREERIHVAGGADEVITVRSTAHGPVLNDVDHRLRDAQVLALRWTATADVDRTVESIFRVDTAATWNEFRAAMSLYGGPVQNFVYADVDGHIGYQLPGAIPIRADDHRGDRPVSGSDGAHDWQGRVAFDALPTLFDPAAGLIVTANNAVTGPAYRPVLGREFDPGYRAARALALLAAADADGSGISVAEMAGAQLDTVVLRAPSIVAGLSRAEPRTADGRLLLDRIRGWDGACGVESEGCAAYMSAEYRVLRDLFDGRLGLDLARDYVGTSSSWQALIGLFDQPADPWWDDASTAGVERAPEAVATSLDRAAADLRAALGQPARWTWGRLHTATFEEQTLGTSGIGPLEWYLNAGPHPAPGAAGALNAAYYRFRRAYPDPADPAYRPVAFADVFEVTNLPSYRQLFDLGDLDAGRIVQTTGNAGNPFDRHYGDLIDDWLGGRTIPLGFSADAIQDAAVSRLLLVPPGTVAHGSREDARG